MILALACFYLSTVSGQSAEFKVYPNGLIYSEKAMNKLGHVVDSLNLKFKTCDFDQVFYAQQQTIGHLVTLKKGHLKAAKKDLEENISFEDFCAKYPQATIEKNVLLLKRKYTTYYNATVAEVVHFDLEYGYGFDVHLKNTAQYDQDFKGQWLFQYHEGESIRGFFFPEAFQAAPLPQTYALMVGYTDCLIDTTVTKFKTSLEEGWVNLPEDWSSFSQKKKGRLLDKMRSTRVVGYCSHDHRPREHAFHIALLAAETYHWSIFLKAHLDIMNDYFPRQSDGSYAWGARKTYLKELEALNIDVSRLLLGICLRVENPAQNHYFGSIGRVGRALAEIQDKAALETAILSAITDTELDLLNRLLFYFLFKNYNHHLEDEARQQANNTKLAQAVATLPADFRRQLSEE